MVKRLAQHAFVLGVLAVVGLFGANTAIHNGLIDLRQSWFPREASGDIAIVAIDPPSIQQIGVWPWPRTLHGNLVERLQAAGVADIAFDVDFSSPSSPAIDAAFADRLRNAGGSVIIPAFKQRGREQVHTNWPLPSLGQASWVALVNVDPERDGVLRRYPYGDFVGRDFVPSMAPMLAGKTTHETKPFYIDFSIRPESIPTFSYVDVLRGDAATLTALRGKKVVIGGTAVELGDRFTAPRGQIIAGPMVQALAAESILQGRELRPAPAVFELLLVALLAIAMGLLWRRVGLAWRLAFLVAAPIAVEAGAAILQAQAPVILDTSMFVIGAVCYMAVAALDELDLRRILGQIADNRFQRITMSLGDALICTDKDGLVTVWNRGAAAIFGYDRADILGRPLGGLLVSNGQAIAFEQLGATDLQAAGGLVMELQGTRRDGSTFPAEGCFSTWQGTDGVQYGIVVRDISARKKEAERIRYLADHDTLTGLANRRTLDVRLYALVEEAAVEDGELALLFLDLDTFKQINDTLGHAAGDQVLVDVATLLNGLVAPGDLVARLGGDEFAIVITCVGAAARAKQLSERIMETFHRSEFSAAGRPVCIKGSIGIALYPQDATSAEQLLGNADLALYRAKAQGRNRSAFFIRSIRDELETRIALEAELTVALLKQQFELFYQPQVNLKDGKLVGVEALIRWHHPVRGLVPPGQFMPVVNTSAISSDVALWVLRTAAAQARKWEQNGNPVRVSVNLSPSLLESGDLAATIETVLQDARLAANLLELEVTENIVLGDENRVLKIFEKIRRLGVQIAWDDFGTGYGSLTYLKKFPLDVLKLDRSFVAELRHKQDNVAIVTAMIGLSSQLGLSVIAEGIEDAETAAILDRMGCHEGQGYYFGKPMPATELEERFFADPARSSTVRSATAA